MSFVAGNFFKKLTGEAPESLAGLEEVEQKVEAATGKPLQVCFYDSVLISPRGSVYGFKSYADLDAKVDNSFLF